ncbi:S-adenosylmethionine:tRNA-ribosyltransferase-isomerase (queuine synthetase) [Paracholeplasma brassicae]|uniref:S-adenosylmethionine:tRNA ribosyltransferase-isomerase n=1 Tax=Acholeplasma brassicae TaxID=61635 RepID=U4KNK2_9MOLU|nr:tRNA preQ1(34) S-adenosylmethionine ribosyltransferase-isomerase QueA [Paracholeplasma brassicae]CCV65851.1 S-adenosylmethionine:tRNA-ribosyltransferase-isomerase (queuine synthetase) [Paracholeplasma brassicae]
MKTNDFDFNLPEELIAQHPLENRDTSRLLIVDRENQSFSHKHFYDILEELSSNDVLVINNTKVMPARLIGEKEDTNAVIELLLLEQKESLWDALVKPGRRVKVGTVISFGRGMLKAKCVGEKEDGIKTFQMIYEGIFYEILEQLGQMPLPPYIHEKLEDKDRYQTVYAKEIGSAAAPTAGLHFTKDLLDKIKEKQIEIIEVTLHVGLGTFRPTSTETIEDHHMHKESYLISEDAANRLNLAMQNKKRIVAVGTTSVRTLESNYDGTSFKPGLYETDIFIYPGYKFLTIGALITNFHLPKSTLVMLVSALSCRELILKAYKEAIKEKYRFFSFGDAMFIK